MGFQLISISTYNNKKKSVKRGFYCVFKHYFTFVHQDRPLHILCQDYEPVLAEQYGGLTLAAPLK